MRKPKSISRQMRDEANKFFDENVKHDLTRKQYKRDFKKFVQFCRERGVRSLADGKEIIQEYSNYLTATGIYSASSCHTFLAPVCKFYGVNMRIINKRIRKVSEYTRGRIQRNDKYRTYTDANSPKWSEIVEFQKCVGARRAELGRIRGCDFKENEDGFFVRIVKGKGGKTSDYYVKPEDVKFVKSYFKNKRPNKLIFDHKLFKNDINLHKLRARHAEEMYFYYLNRVQNELGYRDWLKRLVVKIWEQENIDKKTGKPKKYNKKDLEGLYHLRGSNREKAKRLGKNLTYDRLCMAAVSCLNLAHYRLNICPLYITLYE